MLWLKNQDVKNQVLKIKYQQVQVKVKSSIEKKVIHLNRLFSATLVFSPIFNKVSEQNCLESFFSDKQYFY